MNKLRLALSVIIAFTMCMMTSCVKENATTGQIQGIVTDANTNEALQGVSISLSPIGLSAQTDNNGHFEFTNLEPGQYTLQAEKSGFENSTKNVTVVAGNTTSGDMQLQAVGSNVILTDGLFCYFNFDDEEIVDWRGNYTGINSGTTTSTDTPDGTGKSRQFDGNSLIFVEDNIVPAGSEYTINLWFKTQVYTAQYLIGTNLLYTDWPCYSMFLTESSCINYISGSAIYPTTTSSISNYIDNQWHMLTISVVNGSLAMIYLDGVLFESKPSYGNNGWVWGDNVNMTFIGSAVNNNHAGKFNGKIDNFRSYNHALSASEVQALYQAKQ